MTDTITKPKIKDEVKVERPRLHKVILVNDDFTPRKFVVTVLKAEFRMTEDQALRVMMTAHRRGACVMLAAEIHDARLGGKAQPLFPVGIFSLQAWTSVRSSASPPIRHADLFPAPTSRSCYSHKRRGFAAGNYGAARKRYNSVDIPL